MARLNVGGSNHAAYACGEYLTGAAFPPNTMFAKQEEKNQQIMSFSWNHLHCKMAFICLSFALMTVFLDDNCVFALFPARNVSTLFCFSGSARKGKHDCWGGRGGRHPSTGHQDVQWQRRGVASVRGACQRYSWSQSSLDVKCVILNGFFSEMTASLFLRRRAAAYKTRRVHHGPSQHFPAAFSTCGVSQTGKSHVAALRLNIY